MTSPAGFWLRLLAVLIDSIIFGVFQWLLGFVAQLVGLVKEATPEQLAEFERAGQAGGDPSAALKAMANFYIESNTITFLAVTMLLFGAVTIAFMHLKGGTPGKLALGLKIRDVQTEQNPSIGRAILREYVGKMLLWNLTLGIGILWVGFSKKKRGIHDWIGRTEVVKLADE